MDRNGTGWCYGYSQRRHCRCRYACWRQGELQYFVSDRLAVKRRLQARQVLRVFTVYDTVSDGANGTVASMRR